MCSTADYIFYGGEIVTMDEDYACAEAVAVQGKKIVHVGSLQDALALKGESTQLIFLNNQTLMPGIIEPHQHAIQMILCRCLYVNISGYYYPTFQEIDQLIKSTIATLKPGQWGIFFGWDPELVPNMPILSADYIAKNYCESNPVVIVGQSGHVAWANMAAFKADPEIPDDVENPKGGTFVRDEDGNLTGQFFEEPALVMVIGKAPPPNPEQLEEALKAQWREYAEAGITTTTDLGYIKNEGMDALLELESKRDDCPIRLALYEVIHPGDKPCVPAGCCPKLNKLVRLPACATEAKIGTKEENPFLWKAGVKIIADGSPHAGTAAVREPYLRSNLTDILGFPPAPCYGQLNYTSKDMDEMITTHHNAGSQISVHCHGERACDLALVAYEKILLDETKTDRRHRMEHLGLMTEEQIARAGKIDLGLSFFVNHLYFYGNAYHNFIFGAERTKRWTPCSLGTKFGLRWTLHQDHATHPGPPLPFISMRSAVTRTDRCDPNTSYGPEFCVSIDEAMKAYTVNAAWQLHVEEHLGSLTVGKQADLLVISDNPYKCDPFKLEDIKVIETFVAGRKNNITQLVEQDGMGGTKMFKWK